MFSIMMSPLLKFATHLTGLWSQNINTESKPPLLFQQNPKPLSTESVGSDRFACEITFAYYPELPMPETFAEYGTRLVSTIPELFSKCTHEHDILEPLLFEDKNVKQCTSGIWLCYMQGTVFWESNINPEFGTDDGDWVFSCDEGYPRYIPLSVAKREIKHAAR